MSKSLVKQLEDFRHNVAALERKLYGQETAPFDISSLGNQNVVHIALSQEGKITGVFLCDKMADAKAESLSGSAESWLVETIPPVGAVVPIEYYVGQRVEFLKDDFGFEVNASGKIVWSDDDKSQGIENIMYSVELEGSDSSVIVAGSQITRLV